MVDCCFDLGCNNVWQQRGDGEHPSGGQRRRNHALLTPTCERTNIVNNRAAVAGGVGEAVAVRVGVGVAVEAGAAGVGVAVKCDQEWK